MTVRYETPFAIVPIWILGKVSPRAVEVYVALGAYVDYQSGETFVGQKTIAEDLGVSVDTVGRGISELERVGALSTEERYGDGGRRTTNLYTLMISHPYRNAAGRVPGTGAEDVPGTGAVADQDTEGRDPEGSSDLSVEGRRRNPVWEWVVHRFGLTVETKAQRARVGRVVREISASLPETGTVVSEIETQKVFDELDRRARSWPDHFESATLTPEAYAKHFDALGRSPLRGVGDQARRSLVSAIDDIEEETG